MSFDAEMLELAREVQGCDVRLAFMRADDVRNDRLRRELQERRESAAASLAVLEELNGWSAPVEE